MIHGQWRISRSLCFILISVSSRNGNSMKVKLLLYVHVHLFGHSLYSMTPYPCLSCTDPTSREIDPISSQFLRYYTQTSDSKLTTLLVSYLSRRTVGGYFFRIGLVSRTLPLPGPQKSSSLWWSFWLLFSRSYSSLTFTSSLSILPLSNRFRPGRSKWPFQGQIFIKIETSSILETVSISWDRNIVIFVGIRHASTYLLRHKVNWNKYFCSMSNLSRYPT